MTKHVTEKPTPTPPTPEMGPLIPPRHRLLLSNVLLGGAAVAAAGVVWVAMTWGTWAWPCTLFWIGLSFSFLFVGLWARFYEPTSDAEANDAMRMFVLTAGGLAGLLTTFLGVAVPFAMYWKIFVGGMEAWRLEPAKVFGCFLCLFGGMGLMFAGLLQGRSAQRSSPGLRRLLYGYNTGLTGFLLLTVLALVNLLSYVNWGPFKPLGQQWDWTASQIHNLSPATEKFMEELKEPVKVYSIMPDAADTQQVEKGLAKFRSLAPDKFEFKTISRDLDRKDLQRLVDTYDLTGAYGLLVVYGTAPKEQHEFINVNDIIINRSRRDARGRVEVRLQFRTEPALMKTLTFLSDEKRSHVIYFTQGNGEPDLMEGMAPRPGREQTMAEIQQRLSRSSYQVRPLNLRPGDDKVPSDAAVVVVVNPVRGLPDSAVRALTDYLEPTDPKAPKGKLIAMFDVVPDTTKKGIAVTGLEELVARFGVRVSNRRLLYFNNQPTELLAEPNPTSSNPIALAFSPQGQPMRFLFSGARALSLDPAEANRRYRVEPLLFPNHRWPTLQDADLGDPKAIVEPLRKDRDELLKRIDRQPQPLAATVIELAGGLPDIPGHEGLTGKGDVPRMVVFGDATWVTDQSQGNNQLNGDLFLSCVNWLRQRPDIGEASDGKEQKIYILEGKLPEEQISRMFWMPMALLIVSIVAVGGGIWVVRRR